MPMAEYDPTPTSQYARAIAELRAGYRSDKHRQLGEAANRPLGSDSKTVGPDRVKGA